MSSSLRAFVVGFALLLTIWSAAPIAQRPPEPVDRGLVGTWTLTSVEKPGASGSATVPNPRGVLIFDAAGHALEIVTRAGRRPYAAAQATPAEARTTFDEYAGFWGSYQFDRRQGRITYKPVGAVNPALMGGELTRAVTAENDRLTVTSVAGTNDQVGMRWIWDRVPDLENLSAAQRNAVGFWQHVVERRVNVATGMVVSETRRAPSVIAYTPAGYVGVHFPPLDRKRFAADQPTDDEALAAIRGYVSYFGVYLVYPGMLSHHQLAVLGPGQGTSFRRFYEITGDELNLKFPPAMFQGQQVRTVVTLKRLSGAADMVNH
jgi:lipocalin-like protein